LKEKPKGLEEGAQMGKMGGKARMEEGEKSLKKGACRAPII